LLSLSCDEHDDPAYQCDYADDRREWNRVIFVSGSVNRANVQNFLPRGVSDSLIGKDTIPIAMSAIPIHALDFISASSFQPSFRGSQ
jgi:hypothetical protein